MARPPNPVVDTGSKGCRQAEEGVLSDHDWPVGLLKQLTGISRPSKLQPWDGPGGKNWEEFGEAMEEDYRSASKRFWQANRPAPQKGEAVLCQHCLQCKKGRELLTSTGGHCRTVEEILRGSLQSHRLALCRKAEAGDSEVR
ncbi:hypothetical protein L3Q82_001939 [Scortum barcoo]|uniref:Uncharacterized protein n=1 Tax=Scortum barcoo TaxID=214431 RepID=A0ACB8W1T7_9TELE|nr:hypothetical protein L3Q82_001939 [Scortum barcoo]